MPTLSEHIEAMPTILPEANKQSPEGFTSVHEVRESGREFECDIIQDNIQAKQRLISRDLAHKIERGDWFHGRTSTAYRNNYEQIQWET